MRMDKEIELEEGWIRHNPGDPMPCDGDRMVDVVFGDGWRSRCGGTALFWSRAPDNWTCETESCRIIAWRPVGWEYNPAPKFGQWQPIETAPADGTEFLAFSDGSYDVAWCGRDKEDGSPNWFNGDVSVRPTHWMPLPEPPKS